MSLFPNEDILTKEETESWSSFVDCCIITCLISSLELSQRGNMWPQYVNPKLGWRHKNRDDYQN